MVVFNAHQPFVHRLAFAHQLLPTGTAVTVSLGVELEGFLGINGFSSFALAAGMMVGGNIGFNPSVPARRHLCGAEW